MILAACLTIFKITLVALDANQRNILDWPRASMSETSPSVATQPGSLDDSKFIPWPTAFPEPAAGPTDQNAESAAGLDDAPPTSDPALAFDPSTLTEGQIRALQQLAERRLELDKRERLLDMRVEVNSRAEQRLDEQIDRLTTLKERIEALVNELDEAEELKLARLVKIYETMKPKAAAEIFNRLEIAVILNVVERMKEAKSAVVLGKMDPAIAKRVTTELARRKERPDVNGDNFGS